MANKTEDSKVVIKESNKVLNTSEKTLNVSSGIIKPGKTGIVSAAEFSVLYKFLELAK